MERFISEKLLQWKDSKYRKPLILRGARQVGKTYIVKEFGKNNYSNIAYFNFDNDEQLNKIFEYTKEPERILDQLRIIGGHKIVEGETLIFFDEIQECQNALNSLKYFNENANGYHVIAAGSLLGIKLGKTSFPVGKVEFLDLKPMTFSEFLIASGYKNYVEAMKNIDDTSVWEMLHEKLIEQLKIYYIIGGMPEVIKIWIETKNIQEVYKVQKNIINAYIEDFGKHTSSSEREKIAAIYNTVPSQFFKENKKFLYQVIKKGARAREYENSLNWLVDANLIYKSYNITKPEIPLKAYQDLSAFKIYFNDVGLLTRHCDLDGSFIKKEDFQNEYKGALTENFVFNHLISSFDRIPCYYTFNQYEIDFILQYNDVLIPIEVKSGNNINSNSLKAYNEKYKPNIKVKFSLNKFKKDDRSINIPLYMVEYTYKILNQK